MTTAALPETGHPDLRNVQGNVVGFNKDHQRFVFLAFGEQAAARAFLAELLPDIASGWEVKRFNGLFKEIHIRRGGASDIVQAAWTNVALTFAGLELLGAAGMGTFPEEFRVGMRARASVIGDVEDSDPSGWVAPFASPIHAMAILAADRVESLEAIYARLRDRCQAHGVTELGFHDGNVRPRPARGHEHFGFKDGISQPGIAGLTVSSKAGQDVIAAGEFIVGYPDQDGHQSGQPIAPPQPADPGYNPIAPPPPPEPLPAWCKDGSFVVFRRLRQNVQAFGDFVSQHAQQLGIPPERLGAKLVGRWRSGAPLEHVPGEPAHLDPSLEDPSAAHPNVLDDSHINHFDYADDQDGQRVPRAAHIRKMNPRAEEPPGRGEANRHRILRRGIPYGPEFEPGEPPYPGGPAVPDNQDRGLLFLCYQGSITRGFEFVQAQWANRSDFPQGDDGRDPIISQDIASPDFFLASSNAHLTMARWVQTTGGEYFFAPSIEAIQTLAAGGA